VVGRVTGGNSEMRSSFVALHARETYWKSDVGRVLGFRMA
jgi:hypothetical protein